jgi:hypothetical protein
MDLTPDQFRSIKAGDIIKFDYVLPTEYSLDFYKKFLNKYSTSSIELSPSENKEILDTISNKDNLSVEFKITYVLPYRDDCIPIEVESLNDYITTDTIHKTGDFQTLYLKIIEGQVTVTDGCLGDPLIISETVKYFPTLNPINVIPLIPGIRLQIGDTLQWLYFNPTALKAVKFDGTLIGYDPNTNVYHVLTKNGNHVGIRFEKNENELIPFMNFNNQWYRFSNVARLRAVRQ